MDEVSHCAAILNALRDPALIVNPEERVFAANSAFRSLMPSARVGETLPFVIRSPDIFDAVRRVLGGGKAECANWREHVPVERFFDVFVSPLEVESSERHAIITLRDLTEARRIEQMRADFIANVSHELRTPLSSLLGFVETLQGPAKDDPRARDKFLGIMREQGRRMSRLIDDLLSLSRVEQHQHLRPDTSVDLVSVIRHVVDGFSLIAHEHRVALTLDLPATLTVVGDRDELIRLAENLIGNAIKYGSLPNEDTRVEVSLAVIGAQIRLRVKDHGAGIAREHIPRLTERFYRVDAGASRTNGGTGLGLALVKHIIMRHRGRLQITSTPNEGACFDAFLPLS